MSKHETPPRQKVYLYDTTLRDGAQREKLSFTLVDKLRITEALDDLGIDYIEGGWPLSNPKDEEYFREARRLPLRHARLTAFGSTRKKDARADQDANLNALLAAETPVVCIFGKSWDLHVRLALKTSLAENLRMIAESVTYLKKHDREVVFDAEHFYDGYRSKPEYALKTLEAAAAAGADWVVLCDTNGGSLPGFIEEATRAARDALAQYTETRIGIHAHNDADCAVANSIVAVQCGAMMVHGTINGYGERCGNANLCSIIPGLQLKLGYECISPEQLRLLTQTAHLVSELANLPPDPWQPYVGSSAFSHKGGVHVSAVRERSSTYEHIDPALVGNVRKIIVSELAGRSTIVMKAKELGFDLAAHPETVTHILRTIKKLERAGYHFEAADATFELLVRRELGMYRTFFTLESYRVIVENIPGIGIRTDAIVKMNVNGERIVSHAEGNGPVNALDRALRNALERAFPELKKIRLSDYKVRVLAEKQGTESVVRVLIESTDGVREWGTVGVSENIIEASWQALVDSIEYGLLRRYSGSPKQP
jgi:2-isopropylmalate synthase